MRIKNFNKKDRWDLMYYYRIYEENGNKMIEFFRRIRREDMGKTYLSWVSVCYFNAKSKLNDVLEWGIDYGIEEILHLTEYEEEHSVEIEPDYAYIAVNNELCRNHDNGSVRLDLYDITEDTPCDYYFGM